VPDINPKDIIRMRDHTGGSLLGKVEKVVDGTVYLWVERYGCQWSHVRYLPIDRYIRHDRAEQGAERRRQESCS
jgi:hypothetical protein